MVSYFKKALVMLLLLCSFVTLPFRLGEIITQDKPATEITEEENAGDIIITPFCEGDYDEDFY